MERTVSVLARLARNARGVALLATARTFANELRRTTPLRRMTVTFAWATSPEPSVRAALASALAMAGDTPCAQYTLLVLAADPHPCVRTAAARAAARRFQEDPARYGDLLQRLSRDRHPRVRRAARRASGVLSRRGATP